MTDAAITALENRLKAVTSRLESVEKQLASGGGGSSSHSTTSSSGGASSAFVSAYDNLVADYIDKYVSLSAQIDPLVKQQADLVKAAVTAQRGFVAAAAQSKKPSGNDLQSLLKPTVDQMEKVADIRNKNRAHKMFNWLSTLSEGISALGWVAVEPAPGPFVDEARASSEFYSNKILMEFKTKDGGDLQRSWVAAWNDFLKELRNYIKQYHTTGLTWNPQGGAASVPSGPPTPVGGGGPPPPPGAGPPPPPAGDDHPPAAGASSSKGSDRGALLAQINSVKDRQTGGKTEGLRKVQDHEKTKNRSSDDKSSLVRATGPKSGGRPAAGAKAAVMKPPKLALEANKWCVEFQVDNKSVIIDQTETRQTVYIYRCEGSVIQIKGKVNSIAMDGCKKTALVFENAIASCEAVNCQSIEIQCTGRVPNIAVDKTDGCQLYLSKDCLASEIITSKVSEMNILLPGKDGGDPIEKPVPEQYKTTIKGGNSLVTEAVQHLG